MTVDNFAFNQVLTRDQALVMGMVIAACSCTADDIPFSFERPDGGEWTIVRRADGVHIGGGHNNNFLLRAEEAPAN